MRNRTLFTLGMVAALAACSDSPTDAPFVDGDALDLDIAMIAADGALDDLAAAAVMIEQGADRAGSGERNVTVTFLDADGNEQEAYDALTTATILRSAERTRSAERDGFTATMSATREQTITGLEGENTTRTLNGTGTEEASRTRHTDENGTRTYDLSGTITWTDVAHGVPRSENPYPLSGSITRAMTTVIVNGPNGDETRERTAVITFNGTQFATMTVDGETLEVDLSTRSGKSPFRRPER